MKKKILLLACFCQLLIYNICSSQIPAGPKAAPPCTWNWEDQRLENWRMSDSSNAYRGGDQVCPPFADGPVGDGYCNDAHGLMADVKAKKDYKKVQGWYLVRYSFGKNIDIPYLILYNKYRAILRIFYFIGNGIHTLSYAAATLRFSSNSPAPPLAILSSAAPYKFATDKYRDEDNKIKNDVIVQSVDAGVIQNEWNAVDFAIMFDPNYQDDKYKGAIMSIKVDGVIEDSIQLHGRSAESQDINIIEKDPFVFLGEGNESTEKFDLKEGAVTLKKTSDFIRSVAEELDSIKPKDPEFLQLYKKNLKLTKGIKFLETLSTISSIGSGFFTAANFFNGIFGSEEAASPVINYQVLEFTGRITTKVPMIYPEIKVPGVKSSGLNETRSAFDCPLGLINLSKTPQIKVTTPYDVKCWNFTFVDGNPTTEFYSVGRYVQYKLDTNIEMSINDIRDSCGKREMDLLDLKFAVMCESQKDMRGNYYYDITHPKIFPDRVCFDCNGGNIENSGFGNQNRVYTDLYKGIFVIHKYNPDKRIPDRAEVYFGTPYVDPEYFKGVTFEVPERTDVYLGVSALFKIKGYEQPVAFHAMYKFDTVIVPAVDRDVCINRRQSTFPYQDYYNFERPLITLDKPSTSGTYTTGTIIMEPGFGSKPGFAAKAAPAYKKRGKEIVHPVPYPQCETCESKCELKK